MSTLIKLFITIVCLYAASPAPAQAPAFYHLSTAEGLSDNNVSTAARDRNGVLWIGTTEGLNSFDGNRITTYTKYRYPVLRDNNIDKVLVDHDNNIWIRTANGQLLMLDQERNFVDINLYKNDQKKYPVQLFSTSCKGIIALRNKHHYIRKNSSSPDMVKIDFPGDSILPPIIRVIFKVDRNTIGFCGDEKIVVIDYNSMQVLLNLPVKTMMTAVAINKDELLAYPLEGDAFYRISISQKKVTRTYRNLHDQFNNPIAGDLRNITKTGDERFAITSRFSGMYFLDLKKETIEHWPHDPLDKRSIGGNNPYWVHYDSSGYLFVTTQTSGLNYYNLKQQQAFFQSYFVDDKKEVFDGYIQSVVDSHDGTIWMGAQDRLIKWNRNQSKAVYVPCYLPDGTNISKKETIRALHMDDDSNLWVGTSRYGILLLNKQLQTIRQLTDSMQGQKTALPSNWINSICVDKNKNHWIGTLRGTCMVEKDNFKIHVFSSHPLLSKISNIPCTSLWVDKAGRMWIGTTKGAWCYDEIKNTLKQYTTENGLAHNTVLAFNEDNFGNTYFGTAGGFSVLLQNGLVKTYNRSNGLRNDRCEGILKDDKGCLWIGNLNCIIRYDPVNKNFSSFEEGFGFSHAGFRMRSCYQSDTGEMFWGSDKGLTWFFPDQMNNVLLPLHPSINSLETVDSVFRFTSTKTLNFPL
ncbi:MAG: hypothetical protein IPL84_01360 [Chitinophagaceae bacterium]|nr:hypothetical protein [Chitinophagaceae bacterium]